uniref:Putative UDP-glucose 4-epimerase n=1 Tax=Magnetococcus massalia (strain MO-1) TaxID=451514 RepID=A0A1S7LMD1_MAGMO|nr:Putative UDP-glucose 4-epimerase [Candidatus Magnetococcus massalia]
MKILITGGAGFVGTNLVAHLSRIGGYEITVLDNETMGKREHLAEFGVRFIHGDIRNEADLKEALAGQQTVVHFAADTRVMDSIENPLFNFDVNVVGTFKLFNAAREAGVASIVNASTGGAIIGEAEPPVHELMLPNPVSPYGASKLAVEGYASAFSGSYGLNVTSLRFANVYGTRSFHKGSVVAHFYKQILAGKPLVVYGDGSQVRDYIFVEDLCDGIVRAIESGKSGVFQLGSGVPVSLNQLIDLMREIVGDTYPIEVAYRDARAGEIYKTWCEVSKAKQELGFAPDTPLRDGLTQTWNWFLQRA